MKLARLIPRLTFLLSLLVLLVFLWWHFKLGMTRYFDVDEFAHLHFTSLIVSGNRPYIDFFSFFTPGFWWFLAPLLATGWGSTLPYVTSRIAMFFVFVGLCSVSGLVFWELRAKSWTIILVPLFLAFLPLPFDKFLEIRPDLLAVFFAMLGLWKELQFFRTKKAHTGFWAGIWFALSSIILTKGAPTIIFALLIGLFALRKKVFSMVLGFFLPLVLFSLWVLTLGDLSLVLYSLTKLPLEANRIGKTFFMSPDLFFYPNQIFYGNFGVTRGLIVNHAFWIIGIIIGVYRMLTPYMKEGKRGIWKELLISGTFVTQILLYVLFFPLKHTQYLIPIAVFIAIYVTDIVESIWQRVATTKIGSVFFMVSFFFIVFVLYDTFVEVNEPKLAWTNSDTLSELSTMYKIIPPDAYVLDLEGAILFGKDPYYVCCLPFGQFSQYLSRPLPKLTQSLEKTNTQYIYKGHLDRLSTLSPEDQSYINQNYKQSPQSDVLLVGKP